MGHKSVCLNCRKAFNQGTDYENRVESNCPECGQLRISMPHRFRPPKKSDLKKWEVIKFLVEQGFKYQHVFKDITLKNGSEDYSNYASYPENMDEAKLFVEKYKSQSLNT